MADLVVVQLKSTVESRRWVQIIDTNDGNRVVTAIEVLNPGNKSSGDLNRSYRRKPDEYKAAGVSIVEIGLLRSSRSRLLHSYADIPPRRRAIDNTCVNWSEGPGRWAIYPMPLRSRLRPIPIPCRQTDVYVPPDLEAVIDRAYLEAGHGDIDYSMESDVRLSPSDGSWAAEFIGAARPRS